MCHWQERAFPAFFTIFLTVFLSGAARGQNPLDKIDPQVLAQTAGGNRATFWAIMEYQADLSPAFGLADWAERGRFVFGELKDAARVGQSRTIELLAGLNLEYRSFWIHSVLQVTSGRAELLALAQTPQVSRIRGEGIYKVEPLPGIDLAPQGPVEWNVAQINADDVWNTFGDTGQGIVVGSIDTGVDYLHSALVGQYRGNLGSGAFDHNYNWWDPSLVCGPAGSPPCDNNSHGTHTVGTIAGGDGPGPFPDDIGVAPGVRWIAAKGCEGSFCSLSALLSSGEWMLAPTDLFGQNPRPERRPHVVSNSWGGGSGDPFYRSIVSAWRAAGMFPVFANGNSGSSCSSVGSPGDYPESFGVGATDVADQVAAFSSRGPSYFGPIKPEVSAPGVNVRSSVPRNAYRSLSGTPWPPPTWQGWWP